MKKIWILLCVGSLSIAACNRENTNTDNEATGNSATTATSENAVGSETDNDAEYRNQAARMSSRMSSDLQIDTATEAKIQQVYYNRARRMDEVKRKYNYENQGNVRSGGMAADNEAGNAQNNDMIKEMEAIDVEIDNEFRSILNPDQFKMYETNRASYWNDNDANASTNINKASNADGIQRDIDVDGDEITVKTGDIKVKAEPGKSKVETKTYESKIKGDERKFKSKVDDTKIKSEPGEVKYKSDNTKIKVEEKD